MKNLNSSIQSFTLPSASCAGTSYPAGTRGLAAANQLVSWLGTGVAKRSDKPNGAGMTRIHFDGWPLGPHKQTSG